MFCEWDCGCESHGVASHLTLDLRATACCLSFLFWRARRYSDRSIANKKAYAALHGYDVIVATADDIDRSRPAAWSKLLVLQKHLGSYDYVM